MGDSPFAVADVMVGRRAPPAAVDPRLRRQMIIFVENPIKKKVITNMDKPILIALSSPNFLIVGLKRVNRIPVLKIPEINIKIEISNG